MELTRKEACYDNNECQYPYVSHFPRRAFHFCVTKMLKNMNFMFFTTSKDHIYDDIEN